MDQNFQDRQRARRSRVNDLGPFPVPSPAMNRRSFSHCSRGIDWSAADRARSQHTMLQLREHSQNTSLAFFVVKA